MFRIVRGETERRAAPLSAEDQLVQSMPDASPIKWHRAHTTWFFEQFLLVPHVKGYQPFHPDFAFLFNSYYVTAGPRHARTHRGVVTRPSLDEVTAYRAHVDAAMQTALLAADDALLATLAPLIEIGVNHEQQHQELMLTDILHAFSLNPVSPAYDTAWQWPASKRSGGAINLAEGIHTVGHNDDSYCFDNERPAHRALVGPVKIARDLVTNREWLAFMQDGGYSTATLWLMDGFATVHGRGMECTRPLAAGRRRLACHDAGGTEAARSRRTGLPCELLRGRRVRALERQAPADRDGMGSRRPHRPAQ